MYVGIDFSTLAIDVVFVGDSDKPGADHVRFPLRRADNAFDRTRSVRDVMPARTSDFWDEVVAVAIEEPKARGPSARNIGVLYRVQGAVLACLPTTLLVDPLEPSVWRKAVGLPGNANKAEVAAFAFEHARQNLPIWSPLAIDWPQDASDAYCLALAVRSRVVFA